MFLADVIMWPTYLLMGVIVAVIIAIVCLTVFLIALCVKRKREKERIENFGRADDCSNAAENPESDGAESDGSDGGAESVVCAKADDKEEDEI